MPSMLFTRPNPRVFVASALMWPGLRIGDVIFATIFALEALEADFTAAVPMEKQTHSHTHNWEVYNSQDADSCFRASLEKAGITACLHVPPTSWLIA